MRKKLVIGVTAGVLTMSGLAVAVPALADPASPGSPAVQRITGALSGLVSDGSITQHQADEVASALSKAGIGNHVAHRGGGVELQAAAKALGMTKDQLRTALQPAGTTLAEVAAKRGVPTQKLVDALVTAAKQRIATAVAHGRLTQQQADSWSANLEARITQRVNSARPAGSDHGPGGHRGSPQGATPTPTS
jgi:hypothetical protein